MSDLEDYDPETIWTDVRSFAYLSFLVVARWLLLCLLWILIVAGIAILWEVIK